MRMQELGHKRQFISCLVKNLDTVTIKRGSPVFYKSGATALGYHALSVQNLALNAQHLFAGIAMAELAATEAGNVLAYGIFDGVRLTTQSRSATGAIWGSVASRDIGDALAFNSLANTAQNLQAFDWVGNLIQASSDSIASAASQPSIPGISNDFLEQRLRLAESLASIPTAASDSAATDANFLYRTTTVKAMVRAL